MPILLTLIGLLGCVSDHRLAHLPVQSPQVSVHFCRSVIGNSVEGRPIEMTRFGSAPGGLLIIAGIHGDEPTSTYVARRLLACLESSPEWYRELSLAVIPCANPDGLARGRRTNAHVVDLNRNFPASNWKRARSAIGFGGKTPGSEPETVALLDAIAAIRPRLIISIHSMTGGGQCNNYDGPAEDFARLLSRNNGYPVRANIGYPTPGSLGSWAGIDRNIPIVTLELPRQTPGDRAWTDNRDGLLALLEALPARNAAETKAASHR